MITYIYGTDKYRINEYLREHAPNAMVGEEALKTKGLFDQAPVILYLPDGALAKAGDLPTIPKDVDVFIVSEKKIKKGLEFKPLKDAEIKTWIQEYVRKAGYMIEPNALLLLASRYVDTWQIKLELDTVFSYCYETKKITAPDVAQITTAKIEERIFKLTDAIANKQKGEAVLLLDRQLASGADPYYLFSMIVFQFRNMLAPGRTGVHPYAAQKARLAAKHFDDAKLKKLYQNLHKLELDAKTGAQDMSDGLYAFIFSI